MIRRPSYKQFLNQTKDVQSSINLSFNDLTPPYQHPTEVSPSEIKMKQSNAQRTWQNCQLNVIKYLPNDTRALRHTYAKQPYSRQTINSSFNKSFQMLSPKHDDAKKKFANTYSRSTFRDESKKQGNNLNQLIELSRCYIPKPIDINAAVASSSNKSLYQSKSSTKLRPFKNDGEISKDQEQRKQLQNRRLYNNAITMQRYENKLQNFKEASRSTINLSFYQNKENILRTSQYEIKKEIDTKAQKERSEKATTPRRLNITQNQPKNFIPIQFKKKTSNYEEEISNLRDSSKSPFKRISYYQDEHSKSPLNKTSYPEEPSKSPLKKNQHLLETSKPLFKKISNKEEDPSPLLRKTSKESSKCLLKKTSQIQEPEKNIQRRSHKSNFKSQNYLESQSTIAETTKSLKSKPKLLTLLDFNLGKKLGEGRFGSVLVAIHKLTGGVFALKKIAKSTIIGNFMIDQFILEVKIQSFIDSPYIVKIFGIFDDEQSIYLLLQYLQGGTLYNALKIKNKGKFQQQQVSTKMRMVCQAVNCLHQKGIAHRDIKPQNIIITNEICKLADFGWAACCDRRRKTYCGTTDYVAPEIVEGLQYDMSVDLWCIGVLIYELLSGKAPFYHISRQQTFNKIKNVDISSLNYPQYFSFEAIDFIGKLIKKNPIERMNMAQALKHPFITKYQV